MVGSYPSAFFRLFRLFPFVPLKIWKPQNCNRWFEPLPSVLSSDTMIHFIELLLSNVIYRPYVFVFFACYLLLAITHIGWKRAAAYTALAYAVAFLCEWSSAVAATGFPFGLYYYINHTSDRELWVAGVPFMDSLSFTFLSYVSLELATIFLARLRVRWFDFRIDNPDRVRRSWPAALLAAFLMIDLDSIITL